MEAEIWDWSKVVFFSSLITFVLGFAALWKLPVGEWFVSVPSLGVSGMVLSSLVMAWLWHWSVVVVILVLSLWLFWRSLKSFFNFTIF